MGEERLDSVEELAKALRVPVSRVYAETRKRGKDTIPCIKVGKYYRFNIPDVIAWFAAKTRAERAE